MRLWSIHPDYLDAKGIVALWREALLAKRVLEGRTKGYKHHPQLDRFYAHSSPLDAMNRYLADVYQASLTRGYRFDVTKFEPIDVVDTIVVTDQQLRYEFDHLLNKLKTRAPNQYRSLKKSRDIRCHPLFVIEPGNIASWER